MFIKPTPARLALVVVAAILLIMLKPAINLNAQSSTAQAKDHATVQDEVLAFAEGLEKFELYGHKMVRVKLTDLVFFYLGLSRETRIARLKAKLATEYSEAGQGKFTPQLSFSAVNNQAKLNLQSPSEASQPQSTEYSAKLEQLTPLGLSYYLQLSQTESGLQNYDINLPQNIYNKTNLSENYNQSLVLGANFPLIEMWQGTSANEAKKLAADALKAELQSLDDIEAIVQRIISTYWTMVVNHSYAAALTQKLELSNQLLAEARLRFELNLTTNSDLLEFQAQALQDEHLLAQVLEGIYRIDAALKEAIGLPDYEYVIYPGDELEIFEYQPDLATLNDEMLKEDFATQSLLIENQKAMLDLATSEAASGFELDFNVNYGVNGYGFSRGEASLDNNQEINTYQAELILNIPLGDNGQAATSRANRIRLLMLEEQLVNARSESRLKARRLIEDLRLNYASIKAETSALELRKQLLDQAIENFRIGNIAAREVSEAQLGYLLSQQSLNQAKANYLNNYYDAEISRGRLFDIFPQLSKPAR